MDSGARPHVCGVIFMILMFVLTFRRWFVLCFVYMSYLLDNVQKRNNCVDVPSSQTFR
jgi:hypothetical protein